MLMKNNNKHVQSCFLTIVRGKKNNVRVKWEGIRMWKHFVSSFIDYCDYRTQ